MNRMLKGPSVRTWFSWMPLEHPEHLKQSLWKALGSNKDHKNKSMSLINHQRERLKKTLNNFTNPATSASLGRLQMTFK